MEAAEEAVPGVQEEILSGKIRATDREISSIAKIPKKKRPEVVAELRKPNDVRIAWGTLSGMEKALDRLILFAQKYA